MLTEPTRPESLSHEVLDKMLAACTPEAGLDASEFLRAFIEEQKRTGHRRPKVFAAPKVLAAFGNLYMHLRRVAKVGGKW